MSNKESIKTTVKEFILQSICMSDMDDNVAIFEEGYVNSIFAVELMAFIEKSFSLKIGTDDLDIKNFKSIEAISDFILQKGDMEQLLC